jgi:hypothetical protein
MVIFHSYVSLPEGNCCMCRFPKSFFSDFRSNGSKLDHVEAPQSFRQATPMPLGFRGGARFGKPSGCSKAS